MALHTDLSDNKHHHPDSSANGAFLSHDGSHLARNYQPLPGFQIIAAKGCWVADTQRTVRLDGLSYYGAANFGHLNDTIVAAVIQQMQSPKSFQDFLDNPKRMPGDAVPDDIDIRSMDAISRQFQNPALDDYAERLCALTGLDAMLPSSGGVEAFETAVKAMRRYGYRKIGIKDGQAKIVTAKRAFHGRTLGAVEAAQDAESCQDFGPFTGGFVQVPFGDAVALEKLFKEDAEKPSPEICGFIVEPVQGEAGIFIAPKGYLKQVQAICKKYGKLFFLDEIQSGMGRSGKNFCFQHELDTPPDGLTLAKALSGGLYPLSAFVARKDVMDVMGPGSHGSTFGGHPCAIAAGMAAIDVLENDHMAEQSAERGERLLKSLQQIDSPVIEDIRGQGLWIGVELKSEILAKEFAKRMSTDKRVLCKDAHETVRISPPLNTPHYLIDFIADTVKELVAEMK